MPSFRVFFAVACLFAPLASQAQENPFLKAKGGPAAQYVRISLSGEKRTLTLAEVEVYQDGVNIGPSGKASQSATASGGVPSRAIDGNKSPKYGDQGQTHTPVNAPNPWWELDLGKKVPITSISIWNRGDSSDLARRLDGFDLELLDAERKVVFSKPAIAAPSASAHLLLEGNGKVVYLDAKGKEENAKSWASDRSESVEMAAKPAVEVPSGYADPLPFSFRPGETVALIGNGLGERFQHDGSLEAPIQAALPNHKLSLRNMCVSGDRVGDFPRSKGFTPMNAYLQHVKADVILAFFGYNESFEEDPEGYEARLVDFVQELRSYQPNGSSFPRIVLFSPIAHEDVGDRNLPNGTANNKRLRAYAEATEKAATKAGVAFIDLMKPSEAWYASHEEPLTINGIHLNEAGRQVAGRYIAEQLTGTSVADADRLAKVADQVAEKNWHWFNRYRATDGNDVWGGRSKLKFVNDQTNAEVLQHELVMFDAKTANRDEGVWAAARGEEVKPVDDSNVPPPVPVISNVGGGSKSSNASKEGSLTYVSGEEGIEKMTLAEGYKVNLFADEAMFPEMVNPVQMQVDTQGRLWAAVWPTYPKWEPLKEMKDALVILEDTDNDGVADVCKEFARVHNPLGFEFWNGGVLVTSQPDLIFLKDTDGDDVADVRQVLLHGFGSADTHHTANNLIYGPSGGIYWQSGIFLQHNHEHPWGAPITTTASGMFRWDPRRYTIAFHAENRPNPHGISFDQWGYHYANDGTGGRSYQVRPSEKGFAMHSLLTKEVRPVSADEIVSSTHFPDEIQGNFLVCNTIGYLGLKNYKLHRDGFTRQETQKAKKGQEPVVKTMEHAVGEVWGTPDEELLQSTDGNFRPTDAIFGEDGALYISDWSNVIIGHMQHNIRDPSRDKKHGRIYRMTYPSRALQEPVAIDGEPLAALMKNLEHPVNGVRHRTRVELSERDSDEVIAAAQAWLATLDPQNSDQARHFLEALWVHQQHNVRDRELLKTVMNSPVEHVRINAATVKHHWDVADPAQGALEIVEQEEMKLEPGGLVSRTPELATFRVNTVVEQMKYDTTAMTVKSGESVKVIFVNPDALPHNLVVVKPGTSESVAMAAIALGAEGFAKKFLPDTSDILYATDLLDQGETEELTFTAPAEVGEYPYICTFPGHAMIMRGVLTVE